MQSFDLAALLAHKHLTFATRLADPEMQRVHATLEQKLLVNGRSDLEDMFGKLLAVAGSQRGLRTLDLVGHSTSDSSLLQLGDWVIDATRPSVTAFFRNLADNEVLPRLGIYAVRLLGCTTATTELARQTICTLAEILGLEVQGTTSAVHAGHFTAKGFSDEWRFLLANASDLRRDTGKLHPPLAHACGRTLEIDALPEATLADHTWPYRFISPSIAREVLALVRRSDGAQMPGLLAQPLHKLALPASHHGRYHLLQIVLDGAFVRTYPDGDDAPAILYPVTDGLALRHLIESLPTTTAARPRE